MKPYLFPWSRRDGNGQSQETWLVAFVPQADFEDRNFAAFIGEEQQQTPIYSSVIVVGFTYNEARLRAALPAVRERLPIADRESPDEGRLQLWSIRADGQIEADGTQLDGDETHRLFEAGALALFCAENRVPSRSPVLVAPIGFHFIKPSKKEHTTHFIRAAEVLTDGTEIEFLAASLLRFMLPNTQVVLCDTGAITLLGFALEALYSRFAAAGLGAQRHLAVGSFGSWDGILADPAQLGGVVFDPTALYVISASTGGGLAREMKRQEFAADRITTIFHYGSVVPTGATICHIPPEQKIRAGVTLAHIENFPAAQCPLCDLGSITLTLTGDQFLPTAADVRTIELKLADRPEWLVGFMARALGTGTIRAHHGVGKRSNTHEIFVDLDKLCCAGESKYMRKLNQAIRQSIPFSADRVYFCDDSGAEAIARQTAAEMEKRGLPPPQLIAVSALKRGHRSYLRSGGSSIVVAGCVCSGRSLVALSTMLRDVERDGAIAFLIGLRRTRNLPEQNELQRTLTFANGRLPFALQCVEDIFLPDNTAERDSIWTKEEELLSQLLADAHSAPAFPIAAVEARLELLRQAKGEGQRGLTEELFWPSISGEPLRLRPNFSLFNVPDGKSPSQAELFFTMSAMLHKLRLAEPHGRRLVSNEHQRTLLHPSTFSLFSDGVLQASLLRACLPSELDYEIKPAVEAEAMGLLQDIFSNAHEALGEAATEFLFALALKRMRLSPAGLTKVLEVASDRFKDPLQIEFHLAHYLCRASGIIR